MNWGDTPWSVTPKKNKEFMTLAWPSARVHRSRSRSRADPIIYSPSGHLHLCSTFDIWVPRRRGMPTKAYFAQIFTTPLNPHLSGYGSPEGTIPSGERSCQSPGTPRGQARVVRVGIHNHTHTSCLIPNTLQQNNYNRK